MKKSIWLIVIGIILLAADLWVPIGRVYPDMVKALTLGDMFQGLVTNNFIGVKPSVDIFSDIVGFALIFGGSAMLMRKSLKFFIAMLLIPVVIGLTIYVPLMPYRMEAEDLYLGVAGYTFLMVILEILVEYFVIHGIVNITNCVQNKWHNNEMLAGWIIAMASKGLLVLIDFFFGQKIFFHIYSVILIGVTVFYINRLFKTLEFNPEGKSPESLEG